MKTYRAFKSHNMIERDFTKENTSLSGFLRSPSIYELISRRVPKILRCWKMVSIWQLYTMEMESQPIGTKDEHNLFINNQHQGYLDYCTVYPLGFTDKCQHIA